MQKWLGGQSLGHGPAAPLSFNVRGGVDQHPVEIEEHGTAFEAFHGCGAGPQVSIRSGEHRSEGVVRRGWRRDPGLRGSTPDATIHETPTEVSTIRRDM